MSEHRPPPPITISDPSGGVLTTDLLGSGDDKDPWQPSRRQVAVLLIVVLVVGFASLPVLLVKQHSRDTAADRRELAAISVTQVQDDNVEVTEGKIALVLVNTGPSTLRVLSVHVDRTGYRDQKVMATLKRGAQGTLEINPLGSCPPAGALPASPSGVVVTLKTARGQRTTVRISVRDSFFSDSYAEALRQRCGAYPVQESFVATVVDTTQGAGFVRGRLLLRNRSRVARTISSLTVGEGFSVTLGSRPPFTVSPGPNALDVAFTLKVTNCKLARTHMTAGTDPERAASDYAFQTPVFGGINATSGDDQPFPLVYPDQLLEPLMALLSHTCRGAT